MPKKPAENKAITILMPIQASELKFGEDNTTEIQILKIGEWNHPYYGPVKITKDTIAEFCSNFKKDLRAYSSTIGLPVDEEHRSQGGAVGWMKKLIDRGNEGLFAIVEWNSKGRQLIEDAIYRFFSPEFYFQYEDPESRKVFNNVLVGGAITNRPYFKGLNPVVLSEDILINNDNKNMLLSEIIKKNLADLTNDEKSFITSHFNELSDEDKDKFDELKEETEEEKKAREDAEQKEKEEKEKLEAAEKDMKKCSECGKMIAKDATFCQFCGKKMSEENIDKKVTMSEDEVKQLKEDAELGKKAREENVKMKMAEKVNSFVYSETNKDGKLPATVKDKVTEFAMSLNEDQVNKFFEIIGGLPSAKLFGEIGKDKEGDNNNDQKIPVNASEESVALDKKAREIMANDDKISYGDALTLAEKELNK